MSPFTTKIIELQDEAGRLERLSWRPKQKGGRMLDGRTWDGYPQAQANTL
jgi:hypothetical protein